MTGWFDDTSSYQGNTKCDVMLALCQQYTLDQSSDGPFPFTFIFFKYCIYYFCSLSINVDHMDTYHSVIIC